jgi:hypothetical protein
MLFKSRDRKPAAAFSISNNRFAACVLALGMVFSVLAGWSSPTHGTFLFLGGAWLVIALLLALRRMASRTRLIAVRVPPGVVVSVTTLCLSLALFELGLRLFSFQRFPSFQGLDQQTLGYQHDRSLGWFPTPNSKKSVEIIGRRISIAHNSKGFRDPEPVVDSRPGIIFLGDSFVWGYNVEAEERFTERLRFRHPEWRIYNFGVAGYGTDQEYLLLQAHFQEYQPHIVFLIFCTENDHIDNCANGGGRIAFKPYFTPGPHGLQLHGVRVPYSDRVFCLKHPLLAKSYLARLTMQAWGNFRCPLPPRPEQDPTTALLEAMRQFVVSRGAVFCVGLNGRDAGIERFLRDSNIPCVDLSTDLRAEGDFHWSVQGHAFVADKIEKFLLCSKMF